jgi:phosphatidate phosphatase PAH1
MSKKRDALRSLVLILVVTLCSSCAQLPEDIANAPQDDAQAVVFDIDGTLTPTPLKYWQARSDAAKAVHLFADKGHKIIYLTARIRPLQSDIPIWLEENGFPDGGVYVTQTAEDRRDHGQFKIRVLQDILAHGWKIEYAYGDSSSDFEAYAAVGVPKERVYALRREGDDRCQPGVWQACLNGWAEHIDSIEQ